MPSLVQLTVADPPAVWSDLGFAVHDGVCTISAVDHALGGSGSGLTAWLLAGVQAGADVDGLPTSVTRTGPTDRAEGSDPPHPNGVVAIDHVVVSTPDL